LRSWSTSSHVFEVPHEPPCPGQSRARDAQEPFFASFAYIESWHWAAAAPKLEAYPRGRRTEVLIECGLAQRRRKPRTPFPSVSPSFPLQNLAARRGIISSAPAARASFAFSSVAVRGDDSCADIFRHLTRRPHAPLVRVDHTFAFSSADRCRAPDSAAVIPANRRRRLVARIPGAKNQPVRGQAHIPHRPRCPFTHAISLRERFHVSAKFYHNSLASWPDMNGKPMDTAFANINVA